MRKARFKLEKAYVVSWLDALSLKVEWQEIGTVDIKATKLAQLSMTVGFVVAQDKETVVLAQNRNIGSGLYSDLFAIPIGCIRRVVIL